MLCGGYSSLNKRSNTISQPAMDVRPTSNASTMAAILSVRGRIIVVTLSFVYQNFNYRSQIRTRLLVCDGRMLFSTRRPIRFDLAANERGRTRIRIGTE